MAVTQDKLDDVLIQSYTDTATQARRVFLITNFVTIIILVAYFNLHWTWLRHFYSYDPGKEARPAGYYQIPHSVQLFKVDDTGSAYASRIRERPDRYASAVGHHYCQRLTIRQLQCHRGKDLLRRPPSAWRYCPRDHHDLVLLRSDAENEASSRRSLPTPKTRAIRRTVTGSSCSSTERLSALSSTRSTALMTPALSCRGDLLGLSSERSSFAPCVGLTLVFMHDAHETFLQNMAGRNESLIAYLAGNGRQGEVAEVVVRLLLGAALLGYGYVQAWNILRLAREDRELRAVIQRCHRELATAPSTR